MTNLVNAVRGVMEKDLSPLHEEAKMDLGKKVPSEATVDKENSEAFDNIILAHGEHDGKLFYSIVDKKGIVLANLTYNQFVGIARDLKLKIKPKKDL